MGGKIWALGRKSNIVAFVLESKVSITKKSLDVHFKKIIL